MNVSVLTQQFWARVVAVLTVVSILMSLLPLQVFAQAVENPGNGGGNTNQGSGSVWTNIGPCGSPQNVNQYIVGQDFYGHGNNFSPNTQYIWIVKDPGAGGAVLETGTLTTDDNGDFCEMLFNIEQKHVGGPYQFNVGDAKNDNFKILAGIESTPDTKLTLVKEVDNTVGGDAVASDWNVSATGEFSFDGDGTASYTFSSTEFSALTDPTWVLAEEVAASPGTSTEYYSQQGWECDGGQYDEDNSTITLVKGDDVTCTVTNEYVPPVFGCMDSLASNYNKLATVNDGSCSYQCVVYSDVDVLNDSNGATEPASVHKNWTQSLSEDLGEWIWADTDADTVTFTKYFYVNDVPDGAMITIGADNTYSNATLNDVDLSCDGSGTGNYSVNAGDTCTAPVVQGLNTLKVTVKNEGGANNPPSNPAGFIFELVVDGSLCSDVDTLGTVTIKKEVTDNLTDWSFDFTSGLGDFTLDNTAAEITFDNVVPGTFAVNELMSDAWETPAISCVESEDENSLTPSGDDQLAIVLDAGETVTCTFTNTLAPVPVCPMGDNLFSNGSFEKPVIGSSWSSTAITDWVITKVSDATATVGEIWRDFMGGASEGHQNVELAANEPVVMTQTVSGLTTGATYEVRFDYRSRPNTGAADNGVALAVDGTVLTQATGTVTDWTTYTEQFVAVDADADIAFSDIGTPNSVGTLLDNAVLCLVRQPDNGGGDDEDPTFTISGYKYFDENENGEVDTDEEGIDDWEFELYYDGTLVDTTTTDVDGYYEFVVTLDGEMDPALYEVREVMPADESGWEFVTMYVDSERMDEGVCMLPEATEQAEGFAQVYVYEEEDITLACDFLNYKEVPRSTSSTRTSRGRVAGSSTSTPTPQVLGEQVSVVPLGAADAGEGGVPSAQLMVMAILSRRK